MAVAVIFPLAGSATSYFKMGENIETNEGVQTGGDLYMAAASVAVINNVDGDALVAGGNVLISGNAQGDVMAVGGNVNIVGSVGESVRAVGGNVIIGGSVGKDAVVGGGQVNIIGGTIYGDAIVGAGQLNVESLIEGTLRVRGGEVVINAPVGGNVDIKAEKITLGKKAVISGNFEYTSKNEAVIMEGAKVLGKTIYNPVPAVPASGKAWGLAAILGGWILFKFLAVLTAAIVLTLVCRKFAGKVTEKAWGNFGWELLRGFVVMVVTPVAAVALMVSVLGFMLGILTILAYAIIMILATIFSGIILGSWLFKVIKKRSSYEVNWKTTAVGVIALYVLSLIPFIGWIICFLIILVALGGFTKVAYEGMREMA